MKKVFIGFSRPLTWKPFSAAIMAVEGTPYSHVYIRFETDKIGTLIYQASGTSVNFMGEEVFLSHNQIYDEFCLMVEDDVYTATMKKCVARAGLPYAIKQVVGIAYVRLMQRLFKRNVKNPFADGGSAYVCSELGEVVLGDLGYKVNADPDSVGPRAIYTFLMALNGTRET